LQILRETGEEEVTLQRLGDFFSTPYPWHDLIARKHNTNIRMAVPEEMVVTDVAT
jgi:hypothetical protein